MNARCGSSSSSSYSYNTHASNHAAMSRSSHSLFSSGISRPLPINLRKSRSSACADAQLSAHINSSFPCVASVYGGPRVQVSVCNCRLSGCGRRCSVRVNHRDISVWLQMPSIVCILHVAHVDGCSSLATVGRIHWI